MKNILIYLSIAGILLFPFFSAAADELPGKGPKAFLPETHFEFKPVLEDTQVSHKFILKNTGDNPLRIIDLKSG